MLLSMQAPLWREGQITLTVEQQAGSGRYDQIVRMIENSEKLKSASETRAAALADKLVPSACWARPSPMRLPATQRAPSRF